jgi:glutamate-1-semialdehyde aminotransferase
MTKPGELPSAGARHVAPVADWCPSPAIHPTLVLKRFQARLIDSHGREWVDFLSGWGSNILGYNHPRVLDAIRDQLELGVGTGVRTEAYAGVEHLLQTVIPCADQVAFGKNGSDATTGAARVARAVTGRDRILMRGYHGFHDWCLASDRAIRGIPEAFRGAVGDLPINDLEALETILDDDEHGVAAVMIDPASIPLPDSAYLEGLIGLCRRRGVLIVFDEVVTGFRLAVGGAQEHYGVAPDLACFSKAMANGLPISALVGRSEIMSALPTTRFGMTFGSEVVSLAAAAATISEIRDHNVCSALETTGLQLRQLLEHSAEAAGVDMEIVGHAPRPQVLFRPTRGLSEREMRWLFIQELARKRVLTTGIFLVSAAHTDDDLGILSAAAEKAFETLHRALDRGLVDGLLQPDLRAGVRAADFQMEAVEKKGREAVVPDDSRLIINVPFVFRRAVRAAIPDAVMRRLRPPPPPVATKLEDSLAELLTRVPAGFDWRVYLERYADLAESGVTTEIDAIRHYVLYGANEGRWGTRESRTVRRAMYCPAVDSMFVRAWGALSCWDDAGAETTIQDFDESIHYSEDIFYGPVFDHIRVSMYNRKLPFPDHCSRCICLETDVEHSSRNVDQKIMKVLHVEPSYRCALDCPGCIPRHLRKFAPTPRSLDPAVLEKILGDLRGSGVTVEKFCFQGHGEPLMHPDIPGLARMAKSYYPDAYLTVNTNANFAWKPEYANCGINEFVCSIDGSDQESYEIYRVDGSFDKAFAFMAAAATAARTSSTPMKVVWKYVIFEHNDSPERLLSAQERGIEIELDELVFVFTSLGPMSKRITRPGQIPIMESNLKLSFRSHEPDAADLVRRLLAAEKAIVRGRSDEAAELLESVERTLGRFFGGAELRDSKYREIRERTTRLQVELNGPVEEAG